MMKRVCVCMCVCRYRLPYSQRDSAWAQCQKGRVHLEQMDYEQAEKAFEAAHKVR